MVCPRKMNNREHLKGAAAGNDHAKTAKNVRKGESEPEMLYSRLYICKCLSGGKMTAQVQKKEKEKTGL